MGDHRTMSGSDEWRERLRRRVAYLADLIHRGLNDHFLQAGGESNLLLCKAILWDYIETVNRVTASPQGQAESGDVVLMDTPVWVHDEAFGETDRYIIVGPDEADTAAGRLSCLSPLGTALLLKRVGDRVTINAPGGEFTYRVVGVGAPPSAERQA